MGKAEQIARGYGDEAKDTALLKGIRYTERQMGRAHLDDENISSFRIRSPQDEWGEYMMVAKRTAADGTPQVAFHSAPGLAEVLAGFGSRLRNGSLKWVKDNYA